MGQSVATVRLYPEDVFTGEWRLVGSDLWCPAWAGPPPAYMGRWEAVYA